jgi:hypothetical protein
MWPRLAAGGNTDFEILDERVEKTCAVGGRDVRSVVSGIVTIWGGTPPPPGTIRGQRVRAKKVAGPACVRPRGAPTEVKRVGWLLLVFPERWRCKVDSEKRAWVSLNPSALLVSRNVGLATTFTD